MMSSGDGFSEEDLSLIASFIGENGKIIHVSGHDHGLVNELNPDYQIAKAEVAAWYKQDIGVLVGEMKNMTDEDLVSSQTSPAPGSGLEDGFTDLRLRAMVDLLYKEDGLWGGQNASVYDYVSSRLVGRQGHPLEEEILCRSMAAAPSGEPALESVKSAKAYFDGSRYGMDRAIIGGLGYCLAALLAPEQIRNQMLASILKGSRDNVAQELIWLGAIRQTVLEFVSLADGG